MFRWGMRGGIFGYNLTVRDFSDKILGGYDFVQI